MNEVLVQLIRSPLLAALVAVGGVLATIWFTNKRERDRLEHERSLRLRDERIGAYRKLLAATTAAHVEREAVDALAAAHAEISLLAGSPELEKAARKVWAHYGGAQRTADKTKKDPVNRSSKDFAQALDKARISKEEFLEVARRELGVDP